MSLPVIWLPAADEDLIGIAGLIAEYDEHAALGLVHRIELAALRLADQPYMAPAGRVPGTRELVVHVAAVDGELRRAGGRAPGVEGRNMDHLCLRIADFDAQRIRRELEEAGVATGEEGVRYGASGSAVSLYLRDPEGNGLELRS